MLLTFAGCDDDQDNRIINIEDTPEEIEAYLATHFPDNTVLNVTKNVSVRPITFGVTLAGNVQLNFNEAKEVILIDSPTELPTSVVPTSIHDHVIVNYAGRTINSWQLSNGEQSLELDDGTELVFDLDDNFLRVTN